MLVQLKGMSSSEKGIDASAILTVMPAMPKHVQIMANNNMLRSARP